MQAMQAFRSFSPVSFGLAGVGSRVDSGCACTHICARMYISSKNPRGNDRASQASQASQATLTRWPPRRAAPNSNRATTTQPRKSKTLCTYFMGFDKKIVKNSPRRKIIVLKIKSSVVETPRIGPAPRDGDSEGDENAKSKWERKSRTGLKERERGGLYGLYWGWGRARRARQLREFMGNGWRGSEKVVKPSKSR